MQWNRLDLDRSRSDLFWNWFSFELGLVQHGMETGSVLNLIQCGCNCVCFGFSLILLHFRSRPCFVLVWNKQERGNIDDRWNWTQSGRACVGELELDGKCSLLTTCRSECENSAQALLRHWRRRLWQRWQRQSRRRLIWQMAAWRWCCEVARQELQIVTWWQWWQLLVFRRQWRWNWGTGKFGEQWCS